MSNLLIIGIDASNIRYGGAFNSLVNLIINLPSEFFFSRTLHVWGVSRLLDKLPNHTGIVKHYSKYIDDASSPNPFDDRRQFQRLLWQAFVLPFLLLRIKADYLFVPGGTSLTVGFPLISACHNILPFSIRKSLSSHPSPYHIFRLLALFLIQSITFSRSKRVVFLSSWSRRLVHKYLIVRQPSVIIPNGVGLEFLTAFKARTCRSGFNKSNPLRLVYTSTLDFYKNHKLLLESLQLCLDNQVFVELILLGPSNLPLQRHQDLIESINKLCIAYAGRYVDYIGPALNSELPSIYLKADIGIFASSFENMPIIPLEYMATGLPCLTYSAEPMKSQLSSSSLFFDTSQDLYRLLKSLYFDPSQLNMLSIKSHNLALRYTWSKSSTAFADLLDKL